MNWIQQQIEWVKSFVSESYVNGIAGKASSQRVIELAIVGAFLHAFIRMTFTIAATAFIGPASSALIATISLLDMPWGWATTILGILGIKTYQKIMNEKETGNSDGLKTNEPRNPLPPPPVS